MSPPPRLRRGVPAWCLRAVLVGALGPGLALGAAIGPVRTGAGPAVAAAEPGPAPGASRSHYLNTLDSQVLREAGRADAIAGVAADLRSALVVLAAGSPAADDGSVTLPDTRVRASPREVRAAVVDYVRGWTGVASVRRPDLVVVIGTTNYGTATGRPHGVSWGRLVEAVDRDLHAAGLGAEVRGGLDAELEYNGPAPTLAWVDGYLAGTSRPYVDFGSCTCPPFGPPPLPWSVDDVAAVATGRGRAGVLPQIYATAGGSAKEWALLARTAQQAHPDAPVRLLGVLTETAACAGPPARDCKGIDNPSAQAWGQLVKALAGVGDADLAYASDIGYLTAPVRPAHRAPTAGLVGLSLLVAALVGGVLIERRRRRRA
ncbi:MAG: hypothetical protein M3Z02_02535 [Actinomycetota bacterium]|nr:hypothetical protein [Actinomycetota bacterium]